MREGIRDMSEEGKDSMAAPAGMIVAERSPDSPAERDDLLRTAHRALFALFRDVDPLDLKIFMAWLLNDQSWAAIAQEMGRPLDEIKKRGHTVRRLVLDRLPEVLAEQAPLAAEYLAQQLARARVGERPGAEG